MGGESDISLVDDDADVMALILSSRLELAESLFQQAAYGDAVVAFEAALALAPDSEAAIEGLAQSRLYAQKGVELPEPSAEESQGQLRADEVDVVFHEPGSIGILFEAVSEYAPITIGQVKEESQASERSELVRGLALLRVQGESIQGLKFEQALKLLSNKQRPLSLIFSREPIPSPPASPSPSIPADEDNSPNPSTRTTRDNETPYTREQRDWDDAVRAFNSESKKGVKYMLEVGLVPNTAEGIARMLREGDKRGLSKQQIGEYLSGGKPEDQEFRLAIRTAYLDYEDFSGWSFVTALRSFLQGFRLPGESMLIERIIESFAIRFYEQNPGYCIHLTDEKIAGLEELFTETSGGEAGIGIHLVNSLYKSIGSSFKGWSSFTYLKDAEVYNMMEVTPRELAHTRELIEINAVPPEELNQIAETLRRATALMKLETEAQVGRSQADAAGIAAEQTAVLAAKAHDDERMQLGRDAADRGLEAEYAETVANSAEQAATDALEQFERLSPGFRVELPVFLSMVARKLGADTMFVLAYSVIMLNTDAHNPRLQNKERISKAEFIENNKRSPDLAAISEVIMASLYDEIVSREIKLKDEDDVEDSAAESDTSAAEPVSPAGYLRRLSFIGGDEQGPPKVDFDPADVGQQLYAVQQAGLKGLPRKVKVGLTGMGISVFDLKGRPLTNLLYQSMVKWGVDVSNSQKVLGLRVLTDEASGSLEIFFKTPEGETLCSKLSEHSLAMKKAARLREKAEAEKLNAPHSDLSTATTSLDETGESEQELTSPPPAASATAPAARVETVDAHTPAAAPALSPTRSLALRAGVRSEMDASLRDETLSVQRAYVAVTASSAGVDGAEVPRSGREVYISLHRVYNLQQLSAESEMVPDVVQIPLPPIDSQQPPPSEPEAPLAEPSPAPSAPKLIEFDDEDSDADDNATATSETDSDEDLVIPGPEEHSWIKAGMLATRETQAKEKEAAVADDDGEPQLSTYYSDSRPMAELGSDVRRRVHLTRAFTQLRDELGEDAALEVVAEVYDEVSPQRFADSRPQDQEEQGLEQEPQQNLQHDEPGQEQQTRTLTTPEKLPYEISEDGKEVLF